MNRLVIIGNGFDLAHGLPTSYGSFLNWIWKNFNNGNFNINSLFNLDSNIILIPLEMTCYKDFLEYVGYHFSRGNYQMQDLRYKKETFRILYRERSYDDAREVFSFKNKLFELISERNLYNWVDIENIYYDVLVSIAKEEGKYTQFISLTKLNEDFEQIKTLLYEYLNTEVEGKYNFDKSHDKCKAIVDLFEYNYKDLLNHKFDNFFGEFPASYRDKVIQHDELFHPKYDAIIGKPYNTMLVDFNYTSNTGNYFSILSRMTARGFSDMQYIPIHGQINNATHPINFGFGDEMDDHYKIIEKTNDNEYLRNIKSFMYFNNRNYRDLLNWIESDDFQIFIMGHSCGLSDRTLLNTLFEHNNCKSIKIFYHQKNDGTDNFTELSQNISRHFNRKSMMREKVVDKSFSIPLPQTVRYDLK